MICDHYKGNIIPNKKRIDWKKNRSKKTFELAKTTKNESKEEETEAQEDPVADESSKRNFLANSRCPTTVESWQLQLQDAYKTKLTLVFFLIKWSS